MEKTCGKRDLFKIKGVICRYRYAVIERMLWSYVEYLNETGIIELNMDEGFLKYSLTNRTV